MEKTRILGYKGPSASSIYRIEQIFKYLNRTGEYECVISPTGVQDEQLMWADIIFNQGLVDPKMIADLWAYKVERGKKIVVDRDDVYFSNEDNPFVELNKKHNAVTWGQQLAKIADGIIRLH